MSLFKADLHLHTEHSFDCHIPPDDLIARAVELGLAAVAITDHDTMSGIGLLKNVAADIMVIPGMEISTRQGAHLIGLFLEQEITARDIFDVIGEIHEQKGLVVLPHPYRSGTGLLNIREKESPFDHEQLARIIAGVDLIESLNLHATADEMAKADRFARDYADIPQTAASDAHTLADLGRAGVEFEDVKIKTLAEFKEVLRHAPRLLRCEVYDSDEAAATYLRAVAGVGESLLKRSRKLIPSAFRKGAPTASQSPDRDRHEE